MLTAKRPAPSNPGVAAGVGAPGFFGKVPARGDFVSRRIPAPLLAAWEAWLAALAVAPREALGAAWPDGWLTAPLWHFSLGCALAPPSGAAGVLVASVDRVGRCYPFTILGLASTPSFREIQLYDGTGEHDWAATAEALTMSALADDFDPDALDAALVALGPPPASPGASHAAGNWPLALDGDWPADPARLIPRPEQSTWFCRGSDRMPPTLLRCTGLPDRAAAAAMIAGGFPPPE